MIGGWLKVTPYVCDYLCSGVSILEASWLTLVFTALWKGKDTARAIRAPKCFCYHQHLCIPCLGKDPHFSTDPQSWPRDCSVYFCLGFLMGPSGGSPELWFSQVPIPASHCSQRIFIDVPCLTCSPCPVLISWVMAVTVTGLCLSSQVWWVSALVGEDTAYSVMPSALTGSFSLRSSPAPLETVFSALVGSCSWSFYNDLFESPAPRLIGRSRILWWFNNPK